VPCKLHLQVVGLRQRVRHLGWRPSRGHIRTAVTGNYFFESKTAWMDVWGWSQKGWDRIRQWSPHSGAGEGVPFVWKSPWWGGSGPIVNILWHIHSSWGKSREAWNLSTCSDFYSWGSQIESRPRHRLSWLRSRYFPQSLEDKAGTVLCLYENRQMHICRYVRSHIIPHQHVSATPVTIITVSHNKNTISIQTIVPKYTISSSFILYFCKIVCILIEMLQETLMMFTGVAETCCLRIMCDGT
jgi:hypothetical protein